jgi:hypothetical protein
MHVCIIGSKNVYIKARNFSSRLVRTHCLRDTIEEQYDLLFPSRASRGGDKRAISGCRLQIHGVTILLLAPGGESCHAVCSILDPTPYIPVH